MRHTSVEILALDRLLARYGPETREIRAALHEVVAERIEEIWAHGSSRTPRADLTTAEGALAVERLADGIRSLTPENDLQRSLQLRALDVGEGLLESRWFVIGGGVSSVPRTFLVVLVFWLTITFAGFGLLAPRNPTVLGVLLVCAVSVGSAVFLILEMDSPFQGLLQVSSEPIRFARDHLNR